MWLRLRSPTRGTPLDALLDADGIRQASKSICKPVAKVEQKVKDTLMCGGVPGGIKKDAIGNYISAAIADYVKDLNEDGIYATLGRNGTNLAFAKFCPDCIHRMWHAMAA